MKTFAALIIGCWLLSGHQVRAEKIDFSTTTCKQFLESHKSEIGIILAWLDGYYRDEDDPPIFDTDKFEANAKKLASYCAAHPSTGLITAADELFGNQGRVLCRSPIACGNPARRAALTRVPSA